MPAATDRHCLVAGHIPGGAVDPVASATPPRSSWGCNPRRVWRCGSYVESPGDGSVLIRHEAVAERGRRYRRQVDRFLAHHLDRSTADHVLTVTQSLGPLQRQREVEAYALQSQTGMVESLLARHC